MFSKRSIRKIKQKKKKQKIENDPFRANKNFANEELQRKKRGGEEEHFAFENSKRGKKEKNPPLGVANSLHSKSVQFSPFLVFEGGRKEEKGGKPRLGRFFRRSFV